MASFPPSQNKFYQVLLIKCSAVKKRVSGFRPVSDWTLASSTQVCPEETAHGKGQGLRETTKKHWNIFQRKLDKLPHMLTFELLYVD